METTKQNKILKITAIILLLVNLSTLTTIWIKAESLPTPQIKRIKKFSDKRNKPMLVAELNLNQQQQDFYNSEHDKHREEMQTLRDMIHSNKRMIHTELFKKNPDTLYIKSLSDSIGILNAQFERLNYMHFLKIQTVLDTEQKMQFENLFKQMYSRPEGRKYRHRGGNKR